MPEKEITSALDKAIESANLLLSTDINKIIKEEDGKYSVYSKDGGKKLGPYATREEAEKHLSDVGQSSDLSSMVSKGLPGEILEGGIHLHALERENARTKFDGAHEHVFILTKYVQYDGESVKEEQILVTNEDGVHSHSMESPTSNGTNMDGYHSHTVWAYDYIMDEDGWYDVVSIEMETNEDGRHSHGLQVSTTNFDGLHTHTLDAYDGSTLVSLTPGQVWEELLMRLPQAGQVPLPPSSLFGMLSDEQRAILNALYMIQAQEKTQKNQAPKEIIPSPTKQGDYSTGAIQALKLPDPKFIIQRLSLQKTAGMLSKRNHKVRIDKPQALVNELTPKDFNDSFLWGIVSHGEPQLFKCTNDMPQELFDSVDPLMRIEFSREEDVYYLPLSLVKAFEMPKKLDKPPGGRRFAGKIDLNKNVIPVLTCKNCEIPFEDPGRTKLAFCSECRAKDTKITKFTRFEREVTIIKTEETTSEERYVFGVVLVPDETDAQGDIYDASEVRKAAHTFMEIYGGNLKLMHRGEPLDDAAKVLETYVMKQAESYDGKTYPAGTWCLATRIVDDRLWSDVKSGEFTGYSIGGSAIKEPLA
jgi:hypothetical protein